MKRLIAVTFLSCLFFFCYGCFRVIHSTSEPLTVSAVKVLDLLGFDHMTILQIEVSNQGKTFAILTFNPSQKLLDFVKKIKPGDKIHMVYRFAYSGTEWARHLIKEITMLPTGEKFASE